MPQYYMDAEPFYRTDTDFLPGSGDRLMKLSGYSLSALTSGIISSILDLILVVTREASNCEGSSDPC